MKPDGWQLDPSGAWMESVEQKIPADTTTTTTASQKEKAGWREDGVGRWYQNADGSYIKNRWKTINSSRYYFDEDGYATVGFAEIDGDEYYFSDKGVLKTKNFAIDGEVYIVNSKSVIQDVVDEWDYENGNYDVPESGNNQSSSNQNHASGNPDSTDKNTGLWQEESSSQAEEGLNRELAEQVIELVNAEREKEGRGLLSMNETLMEGCEIRAEELLEKFSHTRPDGSRCFTVLEGQYVYSTVGENIAYGRTVLKMW